MGAKVINFSIDFSTAKMSNISSFRSTREQTRTAVGDTVMGQAGKRVGSDSDLPPMKRTGQPKSAGGVDWGSELEVQGRQGSGEAGREEMGEAGREGLGEVGAMGLGMQGGRDCGTWGWMDWGTGRDWRCRADMDWGKQAGMDWGRWGWVDWGR